MNPQAQAQANVAALRDERKVISKYGDDASLQTALTLLVLAGGCYLAAVLVLAMCPPIWTLLGASIMSFALYMSYKVGMVLSATQSEDGLQRNVRRALGQLMYVILLKPLESGPMDSDPFFSKVALAYNPSVLVESIKSQGLDYPYLRAYSQLLSVIGLPLACISLCVQQYGWAGIFVVVRYWALPLVLLHFQLGSFRRLWQEEEEHPDMPVKPEREELEPPPAYEELPPSYEEVALMG